MATTPASKKSAAKTPAASPVVKTAVKAAAKTAATPAAKTAPKPKALKVPKAVQATETTPKADVAATAAVSASAPTPATKPAGKAILTITSKNYSSWSLRGWLMARFAGLDFDEKVLPPDDPSTRAEILLLSSSIRVPSINHGDVYVWDTLAIGEYLNEICPQAGLMPEDVNARAHCRSICGEMHSGFTALRSALPMNLRAHFPKFKVWSRAQADINRITAIWNECLQTYGGPYLFGKHLTIADAMYAPVCTRFVTYDVSLDAVSKAYCDTMLNQADMKAWFKAAQSEPNDIDELDVEF